MTTPSTTKGVIRPEHTFHAGPLGFCMYCGDNSRPLSDEHIVPYFMAGSWVLKKSSCPKCAEKTRGFEENLAFTAFSGLRHRFRFQSRSKSRPPKFKVLVGDPKNQVEREVSADEMPPLFISWEFRPPGIVEGRPYSEGIGNPVFRFTNLSRFVENEKPFAGTIEVATDPFNNMRLAAKIAHGLFYFQETNREGYLPLLGDVIRTGQFAPYFVGGPPKNEEVEIPDRDGVKPLHNTSFFEVTLRGDNVHTYLIARVSIFVPFGGPVLDVVTARKAKPIANCLAYPYAHPIPTSDGTEIERQPVVLRAKVRSGPSVTG